MAQTKPFSLNKDLFKPIDTYTLYQQHTSEPHILSTGCAQLDALLGGGLHSTNGIYEIVGEAGVGKTQLAMQLCLQVQLNAIYGGLEGGCIYINTESSLRSDRLMQLAEQMSKRHAWMQQQSENGYNWLDYILHYQCNTVDELDTAISVHLKNTLHDNAQLSDTMPLKLIVIDSITSVFRSDRHDNVSDVKRTQSTQYSNADARASSTVSAQHSDVMFKLSAKLKQYSVQCKIPVVILNQVTDLFVDNLYNNYAVFQYQQSVNSSGRRVIPALGLSWANCVNTRLFMARDRKASSTDEFGNIKRTMHVIFCNYLPRQSLHYIVTQGGVCAVGSQLSASTCRELLQYSADPLPFEETDATMPVDASSTTVHTETNAQSSAATYAEQAAVDDNQSVNELLHQLDTQSTRAPLSTLATQNTTYSTQRAGTKRTASNALSDQDTLSNRHTNVSV